MKKYFEIGWYVNESNQRYCTVFALASSVQEARELQKKLDNGNDFRHCGVIIDTTVEEIDEITALGDMWNQIDIVKMSDFIRISY